MVASTGAPAVADAQPLVDSTLAEAPAATAGTARNGPSAERVLALSDITYRRDRFGEHWHLIPAGELGVRGRSLCGEPRQGTSLSESYADVPPVPPDTLCPRCIEAKSPSARGSSTHV